MSRWSSYPSQQRLAENWQRFLENEEEQKIFGINSEPNINPESLLSLLQPLVQRGVIDQELSDALIDLMLFYSEKDGVVLEALGGKRRDARTFSDQTTYALNDLISSAGLSPDAQDQLEAVLDKWARLNTVEFSSDVIPGLPTSELPPAVDPEPEAVAPEEEEVPETTPEDLWQMLDPGEEDGGEDAEAEMPTLDPFEPATPREDGEEEPPNAGEEATDLLSFLADNPEYTPVDTYAQEWIGSIIEQSPQALRPFAVQLGALLKRGGGIDFDASRNPPVNFLDTFAWEEHDNDYLHPDEHVQVRDVRFLDKNNLFVLASRAAEAENQRRPTDLPMDAPSLSLQETLFKKWQLIAGITKKVI